MDNGKNKQSLTEGVYQKIKDLIIYNGLLPGEIITVGEMAERFNVSKTPIRDSLNTLKHEGLVEVLPYKGFLVRRVDVKELLDLFQLRIILEGSGAELAAKNILPQQLEQLKDLASRCKESHENSHSLMRLNYDFHMAIAKGSGNQYIYSFLSNVLNQLQRVLYADLTAGNRSDMHVEHEDIIGFIQTGDGENARKALVSQIEATRNRIMKVV
nr:GntR family transcriptional regulator [Desulforamulus aquiferis]